MIDSEYADRLALKRAEAQVGILREAVEAILDDTAGDVNVGAGVAEALSRARAVEDEPDPAPQVDWR